MEADKAKHGRRLGEAERQRLLDLLGEGEHKARVVETVGCSVATVKRNHVASLIKSRQIDPQSSVFPSTNDARRDAEQRFFRRSWVTLRS